MSDVGFGVSHPSLDSLEALCSEPAKLMPSGPVEWHSIKLVQHTHLRGWNAERSRHSSQVKRKQDGAQRLMSMQIHDDEANQSTRKGIRLLTLKISFRQAHHESSSKHAVA